MARSAPLARASLMVCFARSGPMETATTSPPCFSLRRSASSSAKPSGSFISKPISASRIQAPLSAMRSGASLAGTCLMATAIFIRQISVCEMREAPALPLACGGAIVPAFEQQGGVGAAEAEGIRQGVLHFSLARLVGNVIQVAGRVGLLIVDGRGENLVAQRQNADAGLQSAGAAQQMAGHGLGGADGHLGGVLAECALDRDGFDGVAKRRGSAVGVDVSDLLRVHLGVPQGRAHYAESAVPVSGGLGDVVGIAGHAIADNLREYGGAAA